MATASFNRVERAHQMYREGRYPEALAFYTDALALAKTNPQKIALHSNRAACYLKLHLFKQAAEECTSVLELDRNHTGALMLRAQTLVTLKEYNSALFDVNRLIELNPSSEVYHNLQARLKTQVALAPIPESEVELEEEEEEQEEEEEEHGQPRRVEEEEEEEHGQPCTVKEEEEEEHGQPCTVEEEEEEQDEQKDGNAKHDEELAKSEIIAPTNTDVKECTEQEIDYTNVPERKPEVAAPQKLNEKDSKGCQAIPNSDQKNVPQRIGVADPLEQGIKDSKGWQAIPKPKGHSALDYARWERVEDDSSEDDDDDDDEEESQPRYRFRVRTVSMRPVK